MSEVKEELSQLYAYTGFPRSLNALGVLQKVVAQRGDKNLPVDLGDEPARQGEADTDVGVAAQRRPHLGAQEA